LPGLTATGIATLNINATSNRSAHVESHTTEVVAGLVGVELSEFTGETNERGIRLEWRASASAEFQVERSLQDEKVFVRLTEKAVLGTGGLFDFEDSDVVAGATYSYRLIAAEAGCKAMVFGPYVVTASAPHVITLLDARPNPFNPSTEIRFQLPRDGVVTLSIIAARGRVVSTPVNGPLHSGTHAVTWNGRDSSGIPLASGVYWARLRAFGTQRSRRLVL